MLHAWRWRKGTLTDLGVLTKGYSSYTNAINARGLIVGQSQDARIDRLTGSPSLFVATVWEQGKIKSLGNVGWSKQHSDRGDGSRFCYGRSGRWRGRYNRLCRGYRV